MNLSAFVHLKNSTIHDESSLVEERMRSSNRLEYFFSIIIFLVCLALLVAWVLGYVFFAPFHHSHSGQWSNPKLIKLWDGSLIVVRFEWKKNVNKVDKYESLNMTFHPVASRLPTGRIKMIVYFWLVCPVRERYEISYFCVNWFWSNLHSKLNCG